MLLPRPLSMMAVPSVGLAGEPRVGGTQAATDVDWPARSLRSLFPCSADGDLNGSGHRSLRACRSPHDRAYMAAAAARALALARGLSGATANTGDRRNNEGLRLRLGGGANRTR